MIDSKTDFELIQAVQEGVDADACLREIVNRHSGIYIEMVNYFMPNSMPFVNRTDLIDDKEYNIYRAVMKYDPTKGTKFSTHLGNETKWMCLNLYNKNKKYSQVEFDENFLSSLHDEQKPYQDEIKRELFNKVIEITKSHPDTRVGTIFEMRYVVGNKNRVMPWKRIGEHLNMSVQGCINIHNNTLEKIKTKLQQEK
tara:strand:- start:3918 stop:4508 length:591 start_codon:yes stop_codon:yes gene_type:complete